MELQNKKYQIIYADPPWQYKESWGNASNEHTYNTMTINEIKALPIKDIVDDEAHLYLWVTNPFIKEGLEVCDVWGFDYKTLITWVKLYKDKTKEMGLGYYFRSCTEHIIFGVRGKMKIKNKITRNLFEAVNPHNLGKSHSAKPEIRNKIVEWSGDLSRIELFARERIEGWDAWGNELPNTIQNKL